MEDVWPAVNQKCISPQLEMHFYKNYVRV